jgi:hypothetical protein
MDFHQLEFEIDLHYHSQILVIKMNSNLDRGLKNNFFLATRHDGTHMPKLMRNWLQRSQSQTEVSPDDVPDQGKCQISKFR